MRDGRSLRVLYVAYPLLAVSEDSCGGAEQMLATLEREMFRRGHRTTVAACAGSRVAGELLATGSPPEHPDCFAEREREQRELLLRFLAERQPSAGPFDLVHDQSGSFFQYAGQVDAPVLATLHLPRSFYPDQVFRDLPPNVALNCVSRSQTQTFAGVDQVIGYVQNAIRVAEFKLRRGRGEYLLWMGRICEEKGPHVAIEVADRAQVPLIIAGQVYPFSYHQQYFEREIRPRLEAGRVSYFGVANRAQTLELLAGARALLVPSLVDETSSLVSMEAMACGVPVVALRRGALPEVVADGVTGFVMASAEEMAEAVGRVGQVDPAACRERVERNYSAERMGEEYERLYAQLMERPTKLQVA